MKKQGRQAESFCRAPDPQASAALIFGKPGAPLNEFADILRAKWMTQTGEPLDLKRVTPDDAKADPGSIVDDLFSSSLFGGASLVLTSIQREAEAAPFVSALKAITERGETPAGRLLVIAGDLGTKSKLRKAFEGSKTAYALHFFERSAYEFEGWLKTWLSNEKLTLEPSAEALLVQSLLEDQALAAAELEKLSLYGGGRSAPITYDEVSDLIAMEQTASYFELIDLALDGQAATLVKRLPQLQAGSNAVPVLIGLVNQLKRISDAHDVAASGISGPKIGEKLFPRIYERQWPAFDKRMQTWHPTRLIALLSRIGDIDASCRRAGAPQEALVGRLLVDIANLAAGRR